MIISKTPLRISFFGGGSDIAEFYNKQDGLVISTSINSYINIAINRCSTDHIRVIYSELEVVKKLKDLKHDRVRESLKLFDINSNFELCSFSDITTRGSGLGSSSTFTVGLLNALYLSIGHDVSKKHSYLLELAKEACKLEIERCHQPIGKQDQYAATFGGLNIIRFNKDYIEVNPFPISDICNKLESNILMFNTHMTRNTSDVLSEQVSNLKDFKTKNTFSITQSMVEIAEDAIRALKRSKIDEFGEMLDTTWKLKKQLASNISNPQIDEMYDLGIKSGALGGKLLGAGGGGFMLFYVPENNKTNVIANITKAGYPLFNVKFDHDGTKARKI